MRGRFVDQVLICSGCLVVLASAAIAQEAATPPNVPATAVAAPPRGSQSVAPPARLGIPTTQAPPDESTTSAPSGPDYRKLFRPVFRPAVLIWFGGLLWLMLAIDFRRFWSLRTLDVLAMVKLAVLLQFRHDDRMATLGRIEATYAMLAWTGIFSICAYLFLRTLSQLVRRAARELPPPGIGAAAWIFFGFVVATNFCTVPVADVGDHAVRAALGGQYLRATREMPYGRLPSGEMDGPLMYAIQASFAKPAAATAPAHEPATTAPENLAPTRWISGAAHALLLVGILVLGWQHHSATMGALLAALYGVFAPVVVELAMPDMTVPAALVLWALIAAAPAAGTLGAAISGVLLAAAAGVMFYPTLLAPAWFAYYLRRRPETPGPEDTRTARAVVAPGVELDATARKGRRHAFGALAFAAAFVLVGGAIAGYALHKTRPMSPRADGILAAIDAPAPVGTYELTITGGEWTLSPASGATQQSAVVPDRAEVPLLQWLAADGDTEHGPMLSAQALERVPAEAWAENHLTAPHEGWPPDGKSAPLREIRPGNTEAARALDLLYRRALADYPWWRRTVASARTILESTWMHEGELGPGTLSAFSMTSALPARADENAGSGAWAAWQQLYESVLRSDDASLSARSLAKESISKIQRAHRYVLAGHLALCLLLFLVLLLFKSRCTPWHLCAVSGALMLGAELWRTQGNGVDVPWYLPLVMIALFAGRAARPYSPPPTIAQQSPTVYDEMRYDTGDEYAP